MDKEFLEGLRSAERLMIEKGIVTLKAPTGIGKSLGAPSYLFLSGWKRVTMVMPKSIAVYSTVTSIRGVFAHFNKEDKPVTGAITDEDPPPIEKSNIFYTTARHIKDYIYSRYSMYGSRFFSFTDVLILDDAHVSDINYSLILLMYSHAKNSGFPVPKLFLISATDLTSIPEITNLRPASVEIDASHYPIMTQYVERSQFGYREDVRITLNKIMDEMETKGKSILIFLPTRKDTETFAREYGNRVNVEAHAIHSGSKGLFPELTMSAQDDETRLIFATNIAETSVTISTDLFCVVDSMKEKGMIKSSRDYSPNTFQIKDISMDSADQRMGRVGRIKRGSGYDICYRLISQNGYIKLDEHSTSELHLINLQITILDMISNKIDPYNVLSVTIDRRDIDNAIHDLSHYGHINAKLNVISVTDIGIRSLNIPLLPINYKVFYECNKHEKLRKRMFDVCFALSIMESSDYYFFAKDNRRNIENISENAEPPFKKFLGKTNLHTYCNAFIEYMRVMGGSVEYGREDWLREQGMVPQNAASFVMHFRKLWTRVYEDVIEQRSTVTTDFLDDFIDILFEIYPYDEYVGRPPNRLCDYGEEESPSKMITISKYRDAINFCILKF